MRSRRAAGVAGSALACLLGVTASSVRAESVAFASASASPIGLGPVAILPVTGGDAESPVLAMNRAGRYVISYPQNDPFGPFGVLVGTTSSRRVAGGRVTRLGSGSSVLPLEPAVAPDGTIALGWSVRRQLHPASHVAFGRELAERGSSPSAPWRARVVLAPTDGYDPSDETNAAGVTFDAGGRIVEDWVVRTHAGSRLVLGRQTAIAGGLHTQAVLRTPGLTSIAPAGLATDGRGDSLIALTLTPPERGIAFTRTVVAARESAVAVTATDAGVVGPPERLRQGCSAADLAAGPSGQAAIAMVCDIEARRSQIWVSERSPGGRFGRAVRVSAAGVTGAFPTVSVTRTGRVCVVWDRIVGTAKHYDANIVRTEVSCAAPGRRFGTPAWQTGPYPTQLNPPRLLQGPSGPAVVRGAEGERVELQRLLPRGRLGPTAPLSPTSARDQTVAVDRRGRGVAIWDASIGGKNRPEARTFTLP